MFELLGKSIGCVDRVNSLERYINIVQRGDKIDRTRLYRQINKPAFLDLLVSLVLLISACVVSYTSNVDQGVYEKLGESGLWALGVVFLLRYHNKRWSKEEMERKKRDTSLFRSWISDAPEMKQFITKNKIFEGCSYVEICLMQAYVSKIRR